MRIATVLANFYSERFNVPINLVQKGGFTAAEGGGKIEAEYPRLN